MKTHQIQSNTKGLFLLVDGKEIYPTEESLFKAMEYALVKIEGGEAILTDPSNKAYHEVWEIFHPTPVHVHADHVSDPPFKFVDLVENNLYFAVTTLFSLTVSFFIGLSIGWIIVK
jgi:hypothetical protein